MSQTQNIDGLVLQSGVAVLKSGDSSDDGPFRVRGVALTEEDNTYGSSKSRLYWPTKVVKEAAEALTGTKIVNDREHVAPKDGDISEIPTEPPLETIIGEVTDARYEPGLGVVFEGEIDDPDVAALVENGRVDVSPFIFHKKGPFDEKIGGHEVKQVAKWRDLAVVANGAGSQASIEPAESGETPGETVDPDDIAPGTQATAMSAAVLSAAVDASFDGDSDENGDSDPDNDPESPESDEDLPSSAALALHDLGIEGDFSDHEMAEMFLEAEALASFNHLSYDGTKSGKLDESKIDEEEFASKYLFPGDSKSESSFPVVDAAGYLRRGNVESAWKLRGDAPVGKEEIEQVLVTLAKKFDDPPVSREDAEALAQAQEQNGDESAESDMGSDADEIISTMEIEDEKEQKAVNRYRALDDPVIVESGVEALAEQAEELGIEDVDEPHVIDAEGLNDPHVVEKDSYEQDMERVESMETVLAEALSQRSGISKKSAAQLSAEALFDEFSDDDGEFDAAALSQEPETGDNGGGSSNANPGGVTDGVAALSDEEQAEKNKLAQDVMTVKDWRNVEGEGLSAAEYIEETKDVDMTTIDDTQQLRRKIESAGGD